MIRLKGLSKVYRTAYMETVALDNINIYIRKGEFAAVMAKLDLPQRFHCVNPYAHLPYPALIY